MCRSRSAAAQHRLQRQRPPQSAPPSNFHPPPTAVPFRSLLTKHSFLSLHSTVSLADATFPSFVQMNEPVTRTRKVFNAIIEYIEWSVWFVVTGIIVSLVFAIYREIFSIELTPRQKQFESSLIVSIPLRPHMEKLLNDLFHGFFDPPNPTHQNNQPHQPHR